MAYINKYSERSGTAAAKLEDNVSWEEKKRREKVLNEMLKKTAFENNKKYMGSETVVLIDNSKNGRLIGKNNNYKTILIESSNKKLIGQFVKVKVIEAQVWSLKGKIIK